MTEREEAVLGYAVEEIRKSIQILEAMDISGKYINLLVIGLEKVKEENRRARNEHITGI